MEVHEQRFGRLEQEDILAPGLHFKLPVPFEVARVYDVSHAKTMIVGYEGDVENQNNLWTMAHKGEEQKLLLGAGRELVAINLKVIYRISDLHAYLTNYAAPESALNAKGYEIVMHATVDTDINTVMSEDRSILSHQIEEQLKEYAQQAELGLEVRTAAFRDSRGLLHLEAEGPGCAALARPERLSELSALLGVPLRLERRGEGSLSLIQQEPLMAVAGVAAQRKGGETVSGDAGTYFKRPDGMLYVLLCDGMGSGPEANRESTLAVRLLEQFLQAGVPARQALSTLASALALRGEDAGGFTTVDLLQIDLFTGDGELYKLGAAPTYVKRSGAVQRLSGSALPAGLSAGEEPVSDRFPLRLSPGDTVLMVSDGICGTGDDRWLREKLEANPAAPVHIMTKWGVGYYFAGEEQPTA